MDAITAVFNWITVHEALLTWVFAVLSGALTILQQTGNLKQAALHLILQAEKDFPEKPGPEKMDQAVSYALAQVVPHLPVWLRPLATPKNVKTFLTWVYRTFRSKLEQGAMQNRPAPGGDTQTPPQGQ